MSVIFIVSNSLPILSSLVYFTVNSKLHCFIDYNLNIETLAGLFLFSVVSAVSFSWWVGSACATLFLVVCWMLDLNRILYRNILSPGMLISPSAPLLISQNRVSLHPVDIEQMLKSLSSVSLGTQLQRYMLTLSTPSYVPFTLG